jgi:hypothetical protein
MKQIYKRNELGLLEGVKYEYNSDGSINWRAMIAPEHLYPNKGWFELRNKPMPTSVDELDDNQLLIKLSGIKELARLRGFNSVNYSVIKCELDHVAVKCSISWIPNFENPKEENQNFGFDGVEFEDIANATIDNTSSFAQKFLETIGANRAFVRCVRNFLNVHIVGADEIDTSSGKASVVQSDSKEKFAPVNILMSKVSLSEEEFVTFKEILRGLWKSKKYQNEEAAAWESWSDIPTKEIMKLLEVL